MAQSTLNGIKVAILATDGFEQRELTEPRAALETAGVATEVVSPKQGKIRGWKSKEWGDEVAVDQDLDDADPKDYDALLLPGGVLNPDALRQQPQAVAFVKAFFDSGKPVAAICHGPWMVVEPGCARGRRLTSWPSLQTDIRNAGGDWVDEQVVIDGNLVTSRKPDDIPAFSQALLQLLRDSASGAQPRAAAARPQSGSSAIP